MNLPFLIVGGGVLGVCLLDALAARKQAACLLERNRLASGATGHSGGMVRLWQADPWQVEQSRRSWSFWQTLEKHVSRTGSLYFESEWNATTENRLRELKAAGHRLEWLQGGFPDFSWEGPGAVYEREAGWVETRGAVRAIAARATRAGARVQEGTGVSALVIEDERAIGVRTATGVVRARAVIWAGGSAPLDVVAPWAELPPSQNRAIQLVRLHLSTPMPCLLDRSSRCFARQIPGGPVWVGVGLETPLETDVPVPIEEEDARRAVEALQARWKPAVGATWDEGIRVADRYTPNRRPYLGASSRAGLYWALGGSGACWKYAPALAADLADQLCQEAA